MNKICSLLFIISAAACGKVTAAGPDAAAPSIDATSAPAVAHAIASAMELPTDNALGRADGFDLDGDGQPDNQMASVLAALIAQGFDPQAAADASIDRGAILLLAAYQPGAGNAATFTLFKGATPTPAPCTSDSDATCRHHLDGTGAFTIAGDSHHDLPLDGTGDGATFSGGPGSLTLPLAFAATHPFQVTLSSAHVQLALDAGGMRTAIVGGAIGSDDVDGHVIPGLADAFELQVAHDCAYNGPPPACGCVSGSQGEKWIGLFDKTPDCLITADDLRASDLIKTLLAPDVTIGGAKGLSVGVRITMVKAAF